MIEDIAGTGRTLSNHNRTQHILVNTNPAAALLIDIVLAKRVGSNAP
jgi:hypothetical protein